MSQAIKKLPIRLGSRQLFIPLTMIDWVGAEGNYVRIHVGERSYLIRETMNVMERRLPDTLFVRIQRSVIVNTERVAEVRGSHGTYEVVLRGGQRLPLSRNHRTSLESAMVCV